MRGKQCSRRAREALEDFFAARQAGFLAFPDGLQNRHVFEAFADRITKKVIPLFQYFNDSTLQEGLMRRSSSAVMPAE